MTITYPYSFGFFLVVSIVILAIMGTAAITRARDWPSWVMGLGPVLAFALFCMVMSVVG